MSQPDHTALADRVRQAQQRVDDQRARVQRMIAQGVPTQSAEDLLSELCATLRHMQEQRRILSGSTHRLG